MRQQAEAFERKLLDQRQGLALRPSGEAPVLSNSEYGRDEGDRANAAQAKELVFLENSRERALEQLIDAALSRIRDGTLGKCLNCGQGIPLKRLHAIPWAPYCITCQELLEEQET